MARPLVVTPQTARGIPAPLSRPIGMVQALLRAEGFLELAVSVAAYRYVGGGWPLFMALFLMPDLAMAGYLANRRIGAVAYNLAHTYLAPALLALAGLLLSVGDLYPIALIWAAHIGFDRLAGFGLKYPVAFTSTHLDRAGAAGVMGAA